MLITQWTAAGAGAGVGVGTVWEVSSSAAGGLDPLSAAGDCRQRMLLFAAAGPGRQAWRNEFRGGGGQALVALTENGPKRQKGPQIVCKNIKLAKKNSTMSVKRAQF